MGPWERGCTAAASCAKPLVCKWSPRINAVPSYVLFPPPAGLLVTRLPVQDGMPSYSVLSHTFVGGYILRKVGIKVSTGRPAATRRS